MPFSFSHAIFALFCAEVAAIAAAMPDIDCYAYAAVFAILPYATLAAADMIAPLPCRAAPLLPLLIVIVAAVAYMLDAAAMMPLICYMP